MSKELSGRVVSTLTLHKELSERVVSTLTSCIELSERVVSTLTLRKLSARVVSTLTLRISKLQSKIGTVEAPIQCFRVYFCVFLSVCQ